MDNRFLPHTLPPQ